MNLPVQAQPVLRNTSNTQIAITSINTVMASGCNLRKKIRCAGTVAACAAACASGLGTAACVACFAGNASCIDCL